MTEITAGQASMRVWVAVCSDNVTGVASSQAKAGELYRCGHGEDSPCCFTVAREVDAADRPAWQPPPRHRQAVEQDALPL